MANMAVHVISKRRQFQAALESEEVVYLHCKPQMEGVLVPVALRCYHTLTLSWGYNMPVPIPDLKVGLEAVSGTLTFDGQAHRVYIPYESIYAITDGDGEGVIWEEDAPDEILVEIRKSSKPTFTDRNVESN